MRPILSVALLAASLLVGACQTEPRRVEVVSAPPRPRGIEGTWNSVGGQVAYKARFNAGRFTSEESGTGGLLAEGTYTVTGPGQISILYTSLKRRQQLAANCNQAGDQIACASSNGSTFSLARAL